MIAWDDDRAPEAIASDHRFDALARVGLRAEMCHACGALRVRRRADPPAAGCRCPRGGRADR